MTRYEDRQIISKVLNDIYQSIKTPGFNMAGISRKYGLDAHYLRESLKCAKLIVNDGTMYRPMWRWIPVFPPANRHINMFIAGYKKYRGIGNDEAKRAKAKENSTFPFILSDPRKPKNNLYYDKEHILKFLFAVYLGCDRGDLNLRENAKRFGLLGASIGEYMINAKLIDHPNKDLHQWRWLSKTSDGKPEAPTEKHVDMFITAYKQTKQQKYERKKTEPIIAVDVIPEKKEPPTPPAKISQVSPLRAEVTMGQGSIEQIILAKLDALLDSNSRGEAQSIRMGEAIHNFYARSDAKLDQKMNNLDIALTGKMKLMLDAIAAMNTKLVQMADDLEKFVKDWGN